MRKRQKGRDRRGLRQREMPRGCGKEKVGVTERMRRDMVQSKTGWQGPNHSVITDSTLGTMGSHRHGDNLGKIVSNTLQVL
jgi:hypothetical protein